MSKYRVTFTSMNVSNNGEWTGKGELYWNWLVDGNLIGSRLISNTLKVADGETIQLSAADDVSKNTGESLTVEGNVSEKDNLDKDEFASFKDVYSGPSWGVGNYGRNLRDGKLDVTVNYKIEKV